MTSSSWGNYANFANLESCINQMQREIRPGIDGLHIIASSGTTLYANKTLTIYGLSQEKIMEMNIIDFTAPLTSMIAKATFAKYARSQEEYLPVERELIRTSSDGISLDRETLISQIVEKGDCFKKNFDSL